MKMGINLAANALQNNIHELIQASACPAVVVRATLENELRAVMEWEAQEIQKEKLMLKKEMEENEAQEAEAATEPAQRRED